MKQISTQDYEWLRTSNLPVLVIVVLAALLAPSSVLAQQRLCPCRDGSGAHCPCPLFGGGTGGSGGGTIEPNPDTAGGTGCGTCQPADPSELPEIENAPVRGGDWKIDVQQLLPEAQLQPGSIVTVMLARKFPGQADNLFEPLVIHDADTNSNVPAVYTAEIAEDGNTTFNFGELAADVVGGEYVALAVPKEVDSLDAFWAELPAANASAQQFRVESLVNLDEASAQVSSNGRRVDIPIELAPELAANAKIDLQWSKDNQPLPNAQNPLQAGVYDAVLRTDNQGIVGAYAPGEFIVENFLPGVQLQPYFTPGQYEVQVRVNGVVEDTQTVTVP